MSVPSIRVSNPMQLVPSDATPTPMPKGPSLDTLIIIAVVSAIGILLLTFLVAFPLGGVLLRFRANYTPRRIRLEEDDSDEEGEWEKEQVKSYWGMLKRVWKIEGFGGYYKGLMPTLLAGLSIGFLNNFFSAATFRGGALATSYNSPYITTLLVSLLGIPFVVLVNRATVTPKRLRWFGWSAGRRELIPGRLTKLYLIPGLAASIVLHTGYLFFALRTIQAVLFPLFDVRVVDDQGNSTMPKLKGVNWLHLGLYSLVILLSTAILTPLEVITVRLSVQRNEAPVAVADPTLDGPYVAVPAPPPEVVVQTVEETREPVVELRSFSDNAYAGLIDCAKKIVKEEGFGALYRAWWATLLGLTLSAVGAGVV